MRPLSPAAARVLLGALIAAFLALAVNASVLLPLWEPADEHEHWLVVEHWLREGTLPDLTDMPMLSLNEGVQPPLAYWMFAGGAHALGLADTQFLARRIPPERRTGAEQFLHGADEIFPFAGPVRQFHALRLLDALCGAATVLGAYLLGRRLAPLRPGIALGAAVLVAFNPAFVALCGGLSNDPLAIALSTFALLSLAGLLRAPAPTLRAGLATGALIGLAHMTKLSATFLLPLVPLVLLLRRPRGESWRTTFLLFDGLVAGFVLVTGLFFAWNLAHYGDPFGWSVIESKFGGERRVGAGEALALRFLPGIARSYVVQLAGSFHAGSEALIVHASIAGLAPLFLLLAPVRRRLRAAGADGRVALLFGAAVLVNLAAAARYFLDFNTLHGRYLHPTLPALACLVAACWCWLPRWLGAGAALGLALLCFRTQTHDLGPAFALPTRRHDPHFMAFDPLAEVPAERRLSSLELLEPPDGSAHVEPPELRWALPDDPDTRYTVRLHTPGLSVSMHSWERFGASVRDRFTIPAVLWDRLPPGVPLVAQVIELPTLDEVLAAPPGGLDVRQSAELTLRRSEPPRR